MEDSNQFSWLMLHEFQVCRATIGHAVCPLSTPGHLDLTRIPLASAGFPRSNQAFVVRQNITREVGV